MTNNSNHTACLIAEEHSLKYGERPLQYAPSATIFDSVIAVPQQYLQVCRRFDQLEAIVLKINVPDGFILFAQRLESLFYLQVGIVGCENYPHSVHKAKDSKNIDTQQKKIVYGRRWLIEPSMPTSEVIQTALLAVQKAREHELREHIRVKFNDSNARATPFNTHQDIPLLTTVRDQVIRAKTYSLHETLNRITIANRQLEVQAILPLKDENVLLQLRVEGNAKNQFMFREMIERDITIVWSESSPHEFAHLLVDAIIANSHRYVMEHFTFDGLACFSTAIDPIELARFSSQSRNVSTLSTEFIKHFDAMTHNVDSIKAPQYNSGELGRKQRKKVNEENVTSGYLPSSRAHVERSAIKTQKN